jgi:hypothetical protein
MPIIYSEGTFKDLPQKDFSELSKRKLGVISTPQELTAYLCQNSIPIKSYATYKGIISDKIYKSIPLSCFRKHRVLYPECWTAERVRLYLSANNLTEEQLLPVKPTTVNPKSKPVTIDSTPSTSKGVMSDKQEELQNAIAKALESINIFDVGLFDYQGFDPIAIRKQVLDLGTGYAPFKITLENEKSTVLEFHGANVHNDLIFMVSTGLSRGNKIGKIEGKSRKDMVEIVREMKKAYKLREVAVDTNALTLMRIVNAFPEIAYAILKAGRGRNMIPSSSLSTLMSNPVSFQSVASKDFGKYAYHFLYVSQQIDFVINSAPNKKKTPLKDLWNYMILSYNSPIIKDRKGVLEEPVGNAADLIVASDSEDEIWSKIQNLISSNSAEKIA